MDNPNHELIMELWQRVKIHIQSKDRLEVADVFVTVFDEYNLLDDQFVEEDLDKELRAAARGRLVILSDDEDEDENNYYDE